VTNGPLIPGIAPSFSAPAYVSMREVLKDLKFRASVFQSAALIKFAGEEHTPEEAAAWAIATSGRTVEEAFEWVFCIGRQGGKSQILAPAIVAWTILNAAHFGVSNSRPGSIVVLAPVTRQSKITVRAIERALETHATLSPMITAKRMSGDDVEIEFINGVTVRILPSNPRTARGNSVVLLIGDEVDFFLADDQGNANWNDVYDAVRPGLVSFPGSRVVKISSPAGTTGPMYADKQRAEAGERDLVFFHATTEQMSPVADRKFIQREREKNAAYASREYDAKFLDSAGMWLTGDEIAEAQVIDSDAPIEEVYAALREAVEEQGGVVSAPVVAFDLANKGKDRCTYALACRVDYEQEEDSGPPIDRPHGVVLRLRAFEKAAFAPLLDPRPCVLEGLAEAQKLGVLVAVCDQVMAGYAFGEARDRGIELKHKYTGTESLKAKESFDHVGPLFKEGRVAIPEDKDLARELGGLEDKFTKMKSSTAHDDRATVCVAAIDEAVFQQPRLHKPWFFVI
jgi:hypothetical protein